MNRKKSTKVKWAIGLLIFMCASSLITFANSLQGVEKGFPLFLSFLLELFPTTTAIILVFYDYSYTAPKKGTFSLLRIWTLVLIWVQPILSFLSYASAGVLNSVIGLWIGSLFFPIIAFILLYLDSKDQIIKRESERECEQINMIGFQNQEQPQPKENNEQMTQENATNPNAASKGEIIIAAILAVIIIIGVIIGIASQS